VRKIVQSCDTSVRNFPASARIVLSQEERSMRKLLVMVLIVLVIALTGAAAAQTETALFAGGCFWCMEEAFDKYDGVFSTTSGYSGGDVVNPSYEEVTAGGTGHIEVVRVEYDPEIIEFKDLLYVYWRNVDPFDDGGQFCDRGLSYP
jgi:peptide-methionine (S)-S-oxide reductase